LYAKRRRGLSRSFFPYFRLPESGEVTARIEQRCHDSTVKLSKCINVRQCQQRLALVVNEHGNNQSASGVDVNLTSFFIDYRPLKPAFFRFAQ
jgi:hypothetical protein